MQTDTLIETLVADAQRRPGVAPPPWSLVALLAIGLACLVFFVAVGIRPDFEAALQTIRFDFKFVVTGALAVTAFVALKSAARPGVSLPRKLAWLGLPAGLMMAAVLAELSALPSDAWIKNLIGTNNVVCMVVIPSIGAPVLILFLWALGHYAPPAPVLTGALAGLTAAGFSAVLYAAQCIDDSPLFVAFWYPLASLVLVGAGALAGHRYLRW